MPWRSAFKKNPKKKLKDSRAALLDVREGGHGV
jgi:hypothetical protein